MDWFATALRRIINYLSWDLWIKERGILHMCIYRVISNCFVSLLNSIQTGGGFSNPPSGKFVITPTPKEL